MLKSNECLAINFIQRRKRDALALNCVRNKVEGRHHMFMANLQNNVPGIEARMVSLFESKTSDGATAGR